MATAFMNTTIVAVILCRGRRMGLFKRSAAVGHDAGCWHCITGYLEGGMTPTQQARQELAEETGLDTSGIDSFCSGMTLQLADQVGHCWNVHTFRAETSRRWLELNWEHEEYRWVRLGEVHNCVGTVTWLRDVVSAVEG